MKNTFEAANTPREVEENTQNFERLLTNSGLSALQIRKLDDKIRSKFVNGASYFELGIRLGHILDDLNPEAKPLTSEQKKNLFARIEEALNTLT